MSFQDELKRDFQKMLDYRKAVGYATDTYPAMVMPFIDFCGSSYPQAYGITKHMVDQWLTTYSYSVNNQAVFIACLRQYAKFINFLGKEAFVPDDDYSIQRIPYAPYVFTDTELSTLFHAIDSYTWSTNNKKFNPDKVLSPMFRMMYCCGMRPAEPLRLRCQDVNLNTGDIYIRASKKHKNRHIIMSEDMLRLSNAYDQLAGAREWFFEINGSSYKTQWMTQQFHHCWDRSGLVKHGNPRPYDLRYPNLYKIPTFLPKCPV